MQKTHVYEDSASMSHLPRVEDAVPVCGEDFCDGCGDCLACADPDEPCWGDGTGNGMHRWVAYEDPPTN